MSENPDEDCSPENSDVPSAQDSTSSDFADNSIIGKVKSRVSSILPNRISQWFSPSAKFKHDSSVNGHLSSKPTAKRRRCLDIEDDDDDDDEDDNDDNVGDEANTSNTEEGNLYGVGEDVNVENDNNNNSDEENCRGVKETVQNTSAIDTSIRQPPSKRSCLYTDSLITRDSSWAVQRQPLGASTPALENSSRGSYALPSRTSQNRFTNPNFYGQQNRKEPSYSFMVTNELSFAQDLKGVTTCPTSISADRRDCASTSSGISSRRCLNIPSMSAPSTSTALSRTSTTIHQVAEESNETANFLGGEQLKQYNGRSGDFANYYKTKRQKSINTAEFNKNHIVEGHDSASESGESGLSVHKSNPVQESFQGPATGSNRFGTRSTLGNSLNFYTHLEGRKSLFAGGNEHLGMGEKGLTTSTLSLNSAINRRQFNPSIYGSTSALSDSRLLNTFSPFYKGRTTYGGAAAYGAIRIPPTHIRPTAKTNLSVLSNSLTQINRLGDNSTISNTAKRILDLINDFNTPLSNAKKMAISLKANSPQIKNRLNENDLNISRSTRLSQVRTPYTRPRTSVLLQSSSNESNRQLPPIKELQVPPMSQLLQMKKMYNTTETARQIATKNMLPTIAASINTEYKLPSTVQEAIMPDNVAESMGSNNSSQKQQHTNKIKNKFCVSNRTKFRIGMDMEETVQPVNLPNIAFPEMKSMPKFDIMLPATPTSTAASPSTLSASRTSIPAPKQFVTTPSQEASPPSKDLVINLSESQFNYKFSAPFRITGVTETASTPLVLNQYKFSSPVCVQSDGKQNATLSVTNITQPPLQKTCENESKIENLVSKSPQSSTAVPLTTLFKKTSDEWECPACLLRNKANVISCPACNTLRKSPSNKQTVSDANKSSTASGIPSISSTFGKQFQKSADEWECSACMIRNKVTSTHCVACETPQKTTAPSSVSLPTIKSNQPVINTFGDAYKVNTDKWECPVCLVPNNREAMQCVACQNRRDGGITSTIAPLPTSIKATAATTTNFKFGFAGIKDTKTIDSRSANVKPDASFQSLAAKQKVSKWECDACLTRNDTERSKCVCCEQPKPGSTNTTPSENSSLKFTFGTTAASKFTFGFGAANGTDKPDGQSKTVMTNSQNVLQSNPPTSAFKFGFPTSTATSTAVSPANVNLISNPICTPLKNHSFEKQTGQTNTGLQYNSDTPTSSTSEILSNSIRKEQTITTTTTTQLTTAVFGSPQISSVASPSSSTISFSKSQSPSTSSVKFVLPSPSTTSVSKNEDAVSTSPASKVAASAKFSFETPKTSLTSTPNFQIDNKELRSEIKPLANKSEYNTPSTTPSISSSSTNLIFAGVNTPLATATTKEQTLTTNTTPMFSFGSTITAATSTTSNNNSLTFGNQTNAKPMFGFGSTTTSVTPTTGSINSSNANSNISTFGNPTKAMFSFSSATSAVSSSTITTTTTTTASNIFGLFNSTNAAASVAPVVSNSSFMNQDVTASNFANMNKQMLGAKPSIFASFVNQPSDAKSLSVLDNVVSSSNSSISTTTAMSATFDVSAGMLTTTATKPTIASTTTASCNAKWPTFEFGSVNKDAQSKSAAFSFGVSAGGATSSPLPSIFNTALTNTVSAPVFGSSNNNNNNTSVAPALTNSALQNMFANNSAPTATNNLFGSSSAGNNNSSTAFPPTFGSSTFATMPSFGSTAAASTSGFQFGNQTNNKRASTDTKSDAPFKFGSTTVQNTSGGFNFGNAANAKPAFNFGSAATSAQPKFNFTGSNNETQNTASQPFQFGAQSTVPVFNFTGGVMETASSNTPFQFNANAATASSGNIFAPPPSSSTQSPQQARRKIRTPVRRLTHGNPR